jgi:hypothetical protein
MYIEVVEAYWVDTVVRERPCRQAMSSHRMGTIGSKSETPISRLSHFQGFIEQEVKGRGCGGQIPPGSTRRLEGLTKGFGPIISQGHPFVGQERTAGRMGQRREWANAGQCGSWGLSVIHSSDLILPRDHLGHRNQVRISRQDCRKISSVGSLLLRYTSLSYTHVVPHGRIYKA